MPNVARRRVSYRFDDFSIPMSINGRTGFDEYDNRLHETGETDSLGHILNDLGYENELRTDDEPKRISQGYEKEMARTIIIGGKMFALNARRTFAEDSEGNQIQLHDDYFLHLSGGMIDKLIWSLIPFLKAIDSFSTASRIDIDEDIEYNFEEDFDADQTKLTRLSGFSPQYQSGERQNPENGLTAGTHTTDQPIKNASRVISNGQTLYIGSLSSSFYVRNYDKRAERLANDSSLSDEEKEDLPPMMRTELTTRKNKAEAIRKKLVELGRCEEGDYDEINRLARQLFFSTIDANLTFENETFAKTLGVSSARIVKLDYSKIESTTMSNDKFISRQCLPSFIRANADLSEQEQIDKLIDMYKKTKARLSVRRK